MSAAITSNLGHFWQEGFGQIYPTVTALETAGAVRRAAPGRTSGSAFEVTEVGLARLRELLLAPAPATPARNGVLLRLFFGTHLPPGAPRDLLHQVEGAARLALASYAAVRTGTGADDSEEQGYRTMTLSCGEHVARAQLAWAQECLAQLEP